MVTVEEAVAGGTHPWRAPALSCTDPGDGPGSLSQGRESLEHFLALCHRHFLRCKFHAL